MKIILAFFLVCLPGLVLAQSGWSSDGVSVTTSQNVGVKTTNPQVDLAVNGNKAIVGGDTLQQDGTLPGETVVEVQSSRNAFIGLIGGLTNGGYSALQMICAPEYGYSGFASAKNGDGTVLPIVFNVYSGSGPGEKMRIDLDGNVGIGTSDPQSKLAVNGTITAKEIVVTTDNWPDYVFADGYDLMPLDSVADFIAAKGHLPGVPSAAMAEREGVALGQMQETLLRKLEEMTLYLLDLKQENQRLTHRLQQIESNVAQQEVTR